MRSPRCFFFFFNFNLLIRSVEAGCVGDQVCWFLRLLLNIQLVYYYQQLILLIYVNTLWNFGLLPILSHQQFNYYYYYFEIVLLIIVDLIIASFMEYLPPPSTEWLKQILNGEKWHSPKYEFCQIRQVELLVNFFNKPVGLLIMYLEITKVNLKVEDSFFFKIFDFSAIF